VFVFPNPGSFIMKKSSLKRLLILACCLSTGLSFYLAAPATAQMMDVPPVVGGHSTAPPPAPGEPIADIELPPVPVDPTHPILRLTPDRSEIINLDAPISSFIVGNDEHLGIFIDSARRLILVPRIPGATFFTALGQDGRVVMQRHVIIAAPKENYVRIRRSCALGGGDCQPTQVYYCPDMCHSVSVATERQGTITGPTGAVATSPSRPADNDSTPGMD